MDVLLSGNVTSWDEVKEGVPFQVKLANDLAVGMKVYGKPKSADAYVALAILTPSPNSAGPHLYDHEYMLQSALFEFP